MYGLHLLSFRRVDVFCHVPVCKLNAYWVQHVVILNHCYTSSRVSLQCSRRVVSVKGPVGVIWSVKVHGSLVQQPFRPVGNGHCPVPPHLHAQVINHPVHSVLPLSEAFQCCNIAVVVIVYMFIEVTLVVRKVLSLSISCRNKPVLSVVEEDISSALVIVAVLPSHGADAPVVVGHYLLVGVCQELLKASCLYACRPSVHVVAVCNVSHLFAAFHPCKPVYGIILVAYFYGRCYSLTVLYSYSFS